jgi:septal ring factor EnvC (AmiA/AmiB activator)
MKGTYLAGLGIACFLAAGLAPTTSSDDRQIRELSKRLDTVERSQVQLNQTLTRLAKSVADLEKRIRSSERSAGDLRAATSGGDKQDKRLTEVEKQLAEVSKAVAGLQKQVAPRGDLLTAINRKIDGRTIQLARWLDDYHPKNVSRFHRDEIERIR